MTEDARKTRRALEAYRKQLSKVRAQRRLIAAIEQGGPPCGRAGGGRGSTIGNPTQTAVLVLEREQERLKRLELGLLWRRCILKCYLDTVEDALVRMVLYLRYMDGRTWKQIAVCHGAGATEDALRMLSVRYMEAHPMPYFKL